MAGANAYVGGPARQAQQQECERWMSRSSKDQPTRNRQQPRPRRWAGDQRDGGGRLARGGAAISAALNHGIRPSGVARVVRPRSRRSTRVDGSGEGDAGAVLAQPMIRSVRLGRHLRPGSPPAAQVAFVTIVIAPVRPGQAADEKHRGDQQVDHQVPRKAVVDTERNEQANRDAQPCVRGGADVRPVETHGPVTGAHNPVVSASPRPVQERRTPGGGTNHRMLDTVALTAEGGSMANLRERLILRALGERRTRRLPYPGGWVRGQRPSGLTPNHAVLMLTRCGSC
jgi:hypothetical protein